MGISDSELMVTVDTTSLTSTGFRNQAPGFDPLSGEGARRFGGRFNPSKSFPVLYLCLTRPCVVAELSRQANRQGIAVGDLLPRELWAITTELERVLDLTDPVALGHLGLLPLDIIRDDLQLTQELGVQAREHGIQAIRTPSATGVDHVLAIFIDQVPRSLIVHELIDNWNQTADL